MKTIKTLVKTFTLAVATLALPFAATAAGGDGNIFSIHPLDKPLAEGGAILSPTTLSAAPTLKGGDTVRFVVRLQKNDPGSNPFRLVYTGLGSEPVDMVLNPPQVGVFVSGKLRMAKLEGSPTPLRAARATTPTLSSRIR